MGKKITFLVVDAVVGTLAANSAYQTFIYFLELGFDSVDIMHDTSGGMRCCAVQFANHFFEVWQLTLHVMQIS